MILRTLEPQDWKQLEPIFKAEGSLLPDSRIASGAVLLDGDCLVGYQGLEIITHAGPAWIHPDYRGKGLWKELLMYVNKMGFPKGSGYYIFSDSDRTDSAARSNGMELMPWKIWRKKF